MLILKDYFEEVCHQWEERARKAAESRKQKADAENKGSDEQSPKWSDTNQKALTTRNGTEPDAPPSSDPDFNNHLLQTHLPDPDLPSREDIWPSSDFEIPENCAIQSLDNLEDGHWDKGLGLYVNTLLEINQDGDSMLVDVEMDDLQTDIDHITGMYFISKGHGLAIK